LKKKKNINERQQRLKDEEAKNQELIQTLLRQEQEQKEKEKAKNQELVQTLLRQEQEQEEKEKAERLEKERKAKPVEKSPEKPKIDDPMEIENTSADFKLAMELYKKEQEENIKKQKDDEEIAKRMGDEEKRKEEDQKRKLQQQKEQHEYEETLQLITDNVRKEKEKELEQALEEKRKIEQELEKIRLEKEYDMSEINFPETWVYMGNKDHELYDVYEDSEEYHYIAEQFFSSLGAQNIIISRIQRNQNRQQWLWFYLKKQDLKKKNRGKDNEMRLFHGSRNGAYQIILKDGFDFRVALLSGAIGAGIYFAPQSATSTGYVVAGNTQDMQMLFCRVLLGEVGTGQSGIRRPPAKKNGELYDSVGNVGSMYVVFDNTQAYPEYIISYRQNVNNVNAGTNNYVYYKGKKGRR